MAWIESHQKLKEDPKLFDLMDNLSLEMNPVIGLLHRFWWWCVDHAEDGDLRSFNDNHLSRAVGWDGDSKAFVEAMVKSNFIERDPYFRVVNWWKFIGKYLMSKYKSTPKKWKRILRLYGGVAPDKQRSNTMTQDLPNKKEPTKQKELKTFSSDSDEFRLASLLWDLILERNPEHKPPDLKKWSKHIDLMIRSDNRSPTGIEEVIRFSQADPFWSQNILSTAKLREKYDQLRVKMKAPVNGQSKEQSQLDSMRQHLKEAFPDQEAT